MPVHPHLIVCLLLLPARGEDVLEVLHGVRVSVFGVHASDVDDNFVHARPTVFGQLLGDVLGRTVGEGAGVDQSAGAEVRLAVVHPQAGAALRAPDGLGSTGAYEGVAGSRQVAEAIAAHAEGNNYLVARLIARALAHRPGPLDTKTPGWRQQIPRPTDRPSLTAGPVFRWVLRDQLHEHADRARSLLLPLALAQGAGLPSATVWPAVASELTGVPVTSDDIRWVMRAAGAYIVEELDAGGRSVYRLYHESFADELRADAALGALTAVTRVLLSLVPTDAAAGLRDWSGADPYVLAHLATHAAGCGLLDDLVCDPGFLVHAEPTALQRGLPSVRSTPGRAARAVYEQVGPELSREPDPRARLAQLRLSALQSGAHELAEAAEARGGERLPWDTEWTVPLDDRAAGYRAIGSYEGEVTAVTLLEFDGRKVVVTAETPNRVRLWDFATGTSLGELPGAADHPVRALAPLPGAESSRLLVLSGAQEGFGSRAVLGLFDLRTLAPAGPSVPTRAFAWAVTDVEGRPVVALLEPGAILLVDPTDGRKLARVPVPQVGRTPPWWYSSRGGWRIGMGMRAGQLVVVIAGNDVDSVGHGRIWEWVVDPSAGWQVTRSSHPRRAKGDVILSVAVWEDRTWVVSTLASPPVAMEGQRKRTVHSSTLAEWTEFRRVPALLRRTRRRARCRRPRWPPAGRRHDQWIPRVLSPCPDRHPRTSRPVLAGRQPHSEGVDPAVTGGSAEPAETPQPALAHPEHRSVRRPSVVLLPRQVPRRRHGGRCDSPARARGLEPPHSRPPGTATPAIQLAGLVLGPDPRDLPRQRPA
ncbi:hypothetical protein [Streptomyces sp. NPDC048650]|uniref:hypothetical protein n=1 Tax=Streptomyces sp. NPDC048650 TaxID=3365583 RepID=UPI00371AEAF2